ncbi:MAG: flagellar hook-associated protein FlgL [Woeseiaceae bacterium]|nr:flagellar hook-associated protein FlgL [Woeseiaceae bacterium]
MSERISTLNSLNSSISLMQRLQSSIDLTGRQIASGRRILTPADDPISSARAIELRESLSRTEQFGRNASVATSRLSQEETALSATNDILQRIRVLALQANNATLGNEARQQIGVEVRAQLNQLINLANQKDGNGAYMFAGTRENVQPVVQTGGSFTYNGDDGRRLIQIGEGRTVADGDPGSEIFFRIRSGNGTFDASAASANTGTGVVGGGSVVDPSQYDRDDYTVTFTAADTYEVRDSSAALVSTGSFAPGDTIAFRGIQFTLTGEPDIGDSFDVAPSSFRDVFSMVSNLADAIETEVFDGASQAMLNNGINRELQGLDQAIGSVLSARTQVGTRLSIIEDQENTNSANAITFQETLARIEDLDYAEALSRLSQQTTILEAAQKSFVRTQGLSLFNFI